MQRIVSSIVLVFFSSPSDDIAWRIIDTDVRSSKSSAFSANLPFVGCICTEKNYNTSNEGKEYRN